MHIVHHHVGGRDGSTPFRFPALFDAEIKRVLYDADSPEACFVGAAGQKVRFQINYCPYTSSSKEVSPAFAGYYISIGGMDYVLGEVSKPQQIVQMDARSLDEMDAKPDLLSLDTQGSEGDILSGASAALDHAVAVVSEVQFNPVYLNAPLFGDVSAALQARSFLFVEFQDSNLYAPMRGRMGTRGKGMMLFADGVFFKDPAKIADPIARRKLAFTALCSGHLEFAQSCLADSFTLSADAPAWLRFVDEFRSLCALPGFVPWSFNDGYTAERSSARFTNPSEADVRRLRDEAGAAARKENARTAAKASQGQAMAELFNRHGLPEVACLVTETQAAGMAAYLKSIGVVTPATPLANQSPQRPRSWWRR
jgi:hypothetical protein